MAPEIRKSVKTKGDTKTHESIEEAASQSELILVSCL